MIYLGSDHAGLKYKDKTKILFDKMGIKYADLGAFSLNKDDDYPDYAFKLGKKVTKEKARGILFCGTGTGMAIAANKVKGIRAVEAYDKYTSKMSREHNNSNVLCIGARSISFRKAKKIVLVWLNTEFSREKRHIRRLNKISAYEK